MMVGRLSSSVCCTAASRAPVIRGLPMSSIVTWGRSHVPRNCEIALQRSSHLELWHRATHASSSTFDGVHTRGEAVYENNTFVAHRPSCTASHQSTAEEP